MLKRKFENLTFVRYTEATQFGKEGCDCIVQGTFSDWHPERSKDVDNYALYVIQDDKIVSILLWCYVDEIEMCPFQDKFKAELLTKDYLAEKALEDL